jgi:ATP/maltotriose-dependent transcriptional regulator MalT
VVDFYIATFVSSSRLMIQRGNQSEAITILQEGAETARYLHLPRLAAAVAGEQVRVNLMVGDVRAAEQILADFDILRSDASPPPQSAQGQTWDYLQVAWARLLCEQGNIEQGIGILQAQSKRARDAGRKSHEIGVNVLLSIALGLAGQTAEAEELLARTITESIPLGFIRCFLDEGPRVVTLLERLREKSRRHQANTGTLPEFGAYANQLLATSRSPDRGLPVLSGSKPSTAGSDGSARQKPPFDDLLKSREIEILRLLDQGRSNKEIARAVGIGVETVKWYLKTIFSKLGVARRGQAIIEARRLRLLDEV